ncbi:aspartate aminotransferase family protein [Marinobacter sp. EVN1]|uniref:class-III pyridoxal-phosphate-dependent aminotransferase n=1 Tax=Marinobacter sp. EVN1 TaxID=1397532 RepID=UPI0004B002F1|nr:aspartate aminotransferase family protein [Marinobacter sp. EVN1]
MPEHAGMEAAVNHLLNSYTDVDVDIVSGQNCSLYDHSGNRFVDFEAGLWSAALGHSHPRITRAITDQASKISHLHTRTPNTVAQLAAETILGITGLAGGKCVFLNSGSEAAELSVKVVRHLVRNRKLLSFANSYLSAYGRAGEKSEVDFRLIDWSNMELHELDAILNDIPFQEIGGFILEPGGSGSGFVRFPPSELVKKAVEKVRQNNGIIVANEVTTGMGRTGKWFGIHHYQIEPDIVILGKGLGNGYPVSAIAIERGLAAQLEEGGFTHVQSHQNDPLGCRVAQEVVMTMREEGLVERSKETGAYFLNGLLELTRKHDLLSDARGRGLVLALEFASGNKLNASWAYRQLLKEGFLVGCYPAANILRFDPPLTIERDDIDLLLQCIDSILNRAEDGLIDTEL